MAFPGGRREPGDPDSQATAERETKEEVGLDLSGAERVGRLNDLAGRRARGRISVAAHVYWLRGDRPALTPNHEVVDTVWVTLEQLLDPARHVDYRYPLMPFKKFPGIEIAGQRIIWGLTYRMLEDFFERLDQPFPLTA